MQVLSEIDAKVFVIAIFPDLLDGTVFYMISCTIGCYAIIIQYTEGNIYEIFA